MSRLLFRSAVIVLGTFMVLSTHQRVRLWSGPERAIWGSAVAHSPRKPRPLINYGHQVFQDGDTRAAADAFTTAAALAIEPARFRVEGPMRGRHVAVLNLAIVRASQGRHAEALRLTAEIQPRSDPSFVHLLEKQWEAILTPRTPSLYSPRSSF